MLRGRWKYVFGAIKLLEWSAVSTPRIEEEEEEEEAEKQLFISQFMTSTFFFSSSLLFVYYSHAHYSLLPPFSEETSLCVLFFPFLSTLSKVGLMFV